MPVTLTRFFIPLWVLFFGIDGLLSIGGFAFGGVCDAVAVPRGWSAPTRDGPVWRALRCGATTMIMLRPSCFGEDSTKPSSATSSASRCSNRNPSSGRDCSRPRNMIVTFTLSPCLEEPLDVTLLGLVVVRVDLRAELHLLDDGEGLVAPGLARLLRTLVLELAVVHELADRRTCHRGDLDQIQVGFGGQFECLADRHDADLLALGTDEANLGYADPVVDAWLDGD